MFTVDVKQQCNSAMYHVEWINVSYETLCVKCDAKDLEMYSRRNRARSSDLIDNLII